MIPIATGFLFLDLKHDITFVFAATTCAKIVFCYGYNIVMLSLFARLTVKIKQLIAKVYKN